MISVGTSERLWTASLARAIECPRYPPTNSVATRASVASVAHSSTLACGAWLCAFMCVCTAFILPTAAFPRIRQAARGNNPGGHHVGGDVALQSAAERQLTSPEPLPTMP